VDEDRTIAQALAGVRDAESAFAFIEWFARDWLTPLRDSDGCTAEEVAAVEERLGCGCRLRWLPSTVCSGAASPQ
jgi:hypothetical protein